MRRLREALPWALLEEFMGAEKQKAGLGLGPRAEAGHPTARPKWRDLWKKTFHVSLSWTSVSNQSLGHWGA